MREHNPRSRIPSLDRIERSGWWVAIDATPYRYIDIREVSRLSYAGLLRLSGPVAEGDKGGEASSKTVDCDAL